VEIDYTWDDAAKKLDIVIEQTQRIDPDNPAYAMTIPLDIETRKDGPWKTVYVNMDTRRVEQAVSLQEKPASIEIDPSMTVLMRSHVRQPLEALLHQAEHGTTYFARAWAIDALGDESDARAIALLQRVQQQADADGDEYLGALAGASLKAVTTRVAGK
jgi:hypothetical protein